jgi:uncharacterized protein YodC (DUF2158 family)
MNVGDVVQLRSGGPKMTVKWAENGEACCQWFDAKNEVKVDVFPLASLNPANEDDVQRQYSR